MATWDDVARIVGGLPLTAEQAPHDWRVDRKLLAWERPLRKSDRGKALDLSGASVAVLDRCPSVGRGGEVRLDCRRAGRVLHHPAFRRLSSGAGQAGRDRGSRPRGVDHRGLADAGAEAAGAGVSRQFRL
ncbi:LOW QUALITY PROTEIN: conserved hypothetical protein, partial [Mycobacterium tuberculosis T46]